MKYIEPERLIHSFKTVVAVLIGFLLTRLIGFPADQWIIITIMIVMCAQIYVGSVFQKGYMRFLGTLVGCLFATIMLMAAGATALSILIALCLAGFIFSYIATGREDLSYACSLGAATTAIIMLGQKPSIAMAGARFMEISLGILIATLVSQFLLPIHARSHLRRNQASTLEHLRKHYIACMMPEEGTETRYEEFDENIVKALSKQRQLAKEAAREPFGDHFHAHKFLQTLHTEKEILRSMDFMHNALINIKKISPTKLNLKILKPFNESVVQVLNELTVSLQKHSTAKYHIQLPPVDDLKAKLSALPKASYEETIYLDGFLFSAEILVVSLKRLAELYKVEIDPGSNHVMPAKAGIQ